MTAFVARRLAFAVVTLWAVLTLVFFIVRVVPGDPAQVVLGDQATADLATQRVAVHEKAAWMLRALLDE